MSNLWASSPIQIRGELAIDVKACAEHVTFGMFMNAVFADEIVLTPEQAIQIAEALTEGATHCLAARKG